MRIQTCQAANLPELMERVRERFGPGAVLLSVRRVAPSAAEHRGLPFVVEGNVGFSAEAARPAAAQQCPSIRTAKNAESIAGTIALVGPMGAGKTTTAAKIAGRLAISTQKTVGVISTDAERPGGSALLMAYAAQLGLHGTEAPTASDLQDRITRWNCRGPLVIDTRGCGPRDSWGIERLGALLEVGRVEERYLVLSATEHPAIARECLKAYATIGIKGVVLTRVDQAAGIGHCLEEVRARNVDVKFIGTGERVPEDLTEPSAENLRALEMTKPLTAAYAVQTN